MRRLVMAVRPVVLCALLSGCLGTAETDRVELPDEPDPAAAAGTMDPGVPPQPAGNGGVQPSAAAPRMPMPTQGSSAVPSAGAPVPASGTSTPPVAGAGVIPGLPALPGFPQLPGLPGSSTMAPGIPPGWTYHEVPGALCRDGSPAGYYLRRGAEPNLLIFLNGGGVCFDDFFCGINPANVGESLPGENLGNAALDSVTGALQPVPQTPPASGLLSQDPRNPVRDFNMVFVPYCTGDVYAGTTPDAPVITSLVMPPQQFVGYTNIGLIYDHLDAALRASERVLLAGSSAGSFGTLLNYQRTAEFFSNSEVLALADSGFAFRDPYLEPCLQKLWRELWSLDAILPRDCKACFNADGGGLAEGLGNYLFKEKYRGKLLGGAVSSTQDQIMKLFLSSGLNDCRSFSGAEAAATFLGASSYPAERYPQGLHDFLEAIPGTGQMASYLIAGDLHQHVFRERFFEDNGLGMSIAEWLGLLLQGDPRQLE